MYVKPYKQEYDFWYSIWCSMLKPLSGNVFDNMRHAKRQYKFAVQRPQKCQKIIKNDNMISSLLKNNQNTNIFDKIKKIRGKSNTSWSSRIDNAVGAKKIADEFANIYSELYSKDKEGEKCDDIHKKVQDKISEEQYNLNEVNEVLVGKVLKHLKPNKRDSLFDVSSDLYINAGDTTAYVIP